MRMMKKSRHQVERLSYCPGHPMMSRLSFRHRHHCRRLMMTNHHLCSVKSLRLHSKAERRQRLGMSHHHQRPTSLRLPKVVVVSFDIRIAVILFVTSCCGRHSTRSLRKGKAFERV